VAILANEQAVPRQAGVILDTPARLLNAQSPNRANAHGSGLFP